MPDLLAEPPLYVQRDLKRLTTALDQQIPARELEQNLLVATWNIRAFGNVTKKWTSGSGDSPKRDYRSIRLIAEVLRRFDVIAVQEVKANLRALRYVLKVLGPDWGFLLTDVTLGDAGNDERLAFVFDTRRVRPSGLACELVIPEDEESIPANAFQRQFVRTPYAASFLTYGHTFLLTTLHVYYGDAAEDRVQELEAIAHWMRNWAERERSWGHNFITLGDFNIDRVDDELYQAFTSTGLVTHPAHNELHRTLGQEVKHYDQVGWFSRQSDGVPYLQFELGQAGYFDFSELVLGDLTRTQRTWRMSDHFPLWVEFRFPS